MPRPSTRPKRSPATKDRILRAAEKTLKERGFAGATARTIAKTARVNPALIFYHYGTLNQLLLAVVDRISAERVDDYRSALDGAVELKDFFEAAAALYHRDVASGHATVLSEMIAGSLAEPGLRKELLGRLNPWLDLGADFIARAVDGLPIQGLVEPVPLANGLAAMYLGMDVITHLDGNPARFDSLFDFGRRLAEVATTMMSVPTEGAARRAKS